MSQRCCAGVLWIALGYDQTRAPDYAIAYIDQMSQLAWLELGRSLQQDIARAFQQLLKQLQP